MKDYLAQQVSGARTAILGRNLVREYLQARILGSLQRAGAMVPLAFQGGTCLRFLYSIRRFSEDLDFALERPEAACDLRAFLRMIRTELAAEGYAVELRVRDGGVVHSARVRFAGLLHELGLSPHPEEVLSIRVEVDTRPPSGAGLATTLVRRHVTLRLQHHDQASLLAGKLHAVLQRPWPKGRDFYDLMWYLSDPEWPAPNLVLLDNALRQSGWEGDLPTRHTWRRIVRRRLQSADWDRLKADVGPFLEPGADLELMTRENLELALGAGP